MKRHRFVMHELIDTTDTYDTTVELMQTYRRSFARFKSSTKLDRKLERLSERIGEKLQELSNTELQALTCWTSCADTGQLELDHAALTTKPYIKIRKEFTEIEIIDDDAIDDTETDIGHDKAKLRHWLDTQIARDKKLKKSI